MEWKNKKVFITGAPGFIGGHLRDFLLKQGADVHSLVHNAVYMKFPYSGENYYRGDLKNFSGLCEIIGKIQPDVVFHLGAIAFHDVAKRISQITIETNVMGTTNLLEACRLYSHPRAIVVASSDKAYGESKIMPYVEDMPMKGEAPYEVSKSCTDLIVQMYNSTYFLPVVTTRCGNVFGGGDLNFNTRIIPNILRQVCNNMPIYLDRSRSDGTLKRDYIYVNDVVNAYVTLADSVYNHENKSNAYNFGYGNPTSVNELIELIYKITGNKKEVILRGDPDLVNVEIPEQWLYCEKAKQELGWKPKYTLEQGLVETVEWYRRYFND
jgi:CDP-glucose 4,6-dehydratase